MLSDHERTTLRELERQFMAEDPEFRRSFDDLGPPPKCMSATARWTSTTALLLAVALAALMIIAMAPAAALVFAALATMIALIRKRGDEPGRRDS